MGTGHDVRQLRPDCESAISSSPACAVNRSVHAPAGARIVVTAPACDPLIAPLVLSAPIQLLAYYVAVQKGADGTKIAIGLTGVLLFLYLLIHIAGNLVVFLGPAAFNKYAHTLESFYEHDYEALFGALPTNLSEVPDHAGPVADPVAHGAWDRLSVPQECKCEQDLQFQALNPEADR